MVYTSEIEKLEKRWAENPKGRNFAPLADAYRKAGELDRAIELCKAGLERHPDYVSAHIVYGRCFLDLKNDTAASQVFRKVLDLDPENVLGLKLLADIAERGGRYDEATEWLSRLLMADPMNGDAAEALTRTKGKAAQAKPVPSAAPPPAPTPPPAVLVPEPPAPSGPTSAPMLRPEFVVDHTSEEPLSPQLEVTPPTGDIETFDGTLDFNAVSHDAAKAEGLEVQEEVAIQPQELEVEGLAETQYESGTFAAAADARPEPEPDLPTVDLPLIMPEDVAPPRPPAVAFPSSPATPAALPAWPSPLAPPPAPPLPPPPAAVVLSDDDGAADTAALSRAEPVVTETMADLYLKQGHPEEALRVYQALLAQRPDDARLHARIDALTPGNERRGGGAGGQGGGTGESVPTFLRRILAGRPQVAAEAAASSLERAFAVASPEPPSQRDDATLGEASRPGDDTISLDQVFGDEESRAPPPAAEPVAPHPPSGAAPAASSTGGFSFDQFFGASGARPEDAAPPPGGAPRGGGGGRPSGAGPKPRAPLEDEGDLDQFQAWLKGLKS